MKLTLQIVITDESGVSRTEELMTLQKSGDAQNDIGLSLSESKSLLNTVQQAMVQQQADEYTHQGNRLWWVWPVKNSVNCMVSI